MTRQRNTGDAFELAAEQYVQACGADTLARNVRCRYGEIDLVLRDKNSIVFAEVRYRNGSGFGGAAASVGNAKQRRLISAAQFYLQAHPALARMPCRFDVIAISGVIAQPQIEWLKDAFRVDA